MRDVGQLREALHYGCAIGTDNDVAGSSIAES
jgi:hypothetical protein